MSSDLTPYERGWQRTRWVLLAAWLVAFFALVLLPLVLAFVSELPRAPHET